jgi:putative transposase
MAETLSCVRRRVNVAICGYCLMPDHWHAILFPEEPATISNVMLRIKTAFAQRLRKARPGTQPVWQARFYDHILRTGLEFDEALAYMHENPVKRGLAENPLDWKWSSARWFFDRSGRLKSMRSSYR